MSEQCSAPHRSGSSSYAKAKGLSPERTLSARCGGVEPQSVIARIERKKSTPTISTFVKIADALGAKLTICSVE
ncbi:MAG: helix-turn-helix domain-containing protein [Oscillospiraceae bacterium]